MDLLADLAFRGLLYQQTDAEGFARHLAAPRFVYGGFDPTADSLTVGNLVAIMLLARYQRAGHTPVVLMGGGTGMIGDPSGRDKERGILSPERIAHNIAGQRPIFERLLDFSCSNAARIVNNADWLSKLSYIEALRDVGKHFSVNMMIQKDSVRDRLQNREQGISYTEFSYMLLQAYDFLHLYDAEQVTVQVAGSDQWGNIVAGVDLVRRTRKVEVFGQTTPLVTKADGGKFGKSESGAVWLTANLTSPYALFQFWLNTSDEDVLKYLKVFTLLERAEIEQLESEQLANAAARPAQRALATHMTQLIHGPDGLANAEAVTQALFSGEVNTLSKSAIDEVFAHAPSVSLPRDRLSGEGMLAVDLLVDAQAVKSKREARELLVAGAVMLSGRKSSAETRVNSEWLLHGEVLLIRRGKKTWHVVRFV
jgi:tyrosyl-tRNA synthetase